MAHEEFKKIFDFFSLPPEEKSKNLDEVFKNTVEFFDRFQYVLSHGTPEEKKQIIDEVLELQKKLKIETEQMCEVTGLSEDDLKKFAQDPKNFTEDEWKTIQEAKAQIEEKAGEISGRVNFKGEDKQASGSKPNKKKKKWVKS